MSESQTPPTGPVAPGPPEMDNPYLPASEEKAPAPAGRLGSWKSFHLAPPERRYTAGEYLSGFLRSWFRPSSLLALLLFILLCGVYIAQASVYWVAVIDDSYITFRFVDMFVQGHGWRFSPLGPRVEGFTNFLWAAMLVPPHMMGWDLMFVSKVLGLACGIATMGASWGLCAAIRRRNDLFNLVPPTVLAVNAHFAHWGLMGLETLLQCALVTACYWRFEREVQDQRLHLLSPIIAVLAAMTRIDSLFYLSPLGLYGLWMVLAWRIPFRRMFRWGMLAAVPFLLYSGWKWTYFGDPLPNTYYAKQRHVINEGHERGVIQIQTFYLDQAGFKRTEPPALDRIPAESMQRWPLRIERVLWDITLASRNSLIWMNFWILGLALSLTAALLPLLLRPAILMNWDMRALVDTAPPVLCLVLIPWGLNFYYVHHVNGDWMPNFRFFQVVIPFIGVAGGVGLGVLPVLAEALSARRWKRVTARLLAGLATVYLLLGVAVEQFTIHSIYIFGPNAVHWGGREGRWYLPSRIAANYRKGFSPPLEQVSNYLLLNTQDDGWIFMSDIGQPLWFAEHLGLYDVDGLTDPMLAHAPSMRGNLPTVEEIYDRLLLERGIERGAVRDEKVWSEAERRNFRNYIDRNANWIMTQRRPEYLLIFLNHPSPDPKTNGYAYPEISNAVYQHPNMADYEEDAAMSKIGNVYNHVFRRKDVPKDVPDEVKLRRLFRAIERNPRMPYLIELLYTESRKMENLPPENRERVNALVRDAMRRWSDDPVISRLASAARTAGDDQIALEGLLLSIEKSPDNASLYFALAGHYQKEQKLQEAVDTLWKADALGGAQGNGALYQIAWYYEQMRDIDNARRVAKMAIERQPGDSRARSDYAAMLERVSHDHLRTPEERLALKRESLEAFGEMVRILGETPPHIARVMESLRKGIAELENPPAPPREERQPANGAESDAPTSPTATTMPSAVYPGAHPGASRRPPPDRNDAADDEESEYR